MPQALEAAAVAGPGCRAPQPPGRSYLTFTILPGPAWQQYQQVSNARRNIPAPAPEGQKS
jgi:hypothetical protein